MSNATTAAMDSNPKPAQSNASAAVAQLAGILAGMRARNGVIGVPARAY